jgi:hypothetical protein
VSNFLGAHHSEAAFFGFCHEDLSLERPSFLEYIPVQIGNTANPKAFLGILRKKPTGTLFFQLIFNRFQRGLMGFEYFPDLVNDFRMVLGDVISLSWIRRHIEEQRGIQNRPLTGYF